MTARQLIKWGRVFMSLVSRGSAVAEAWRRATELVYTAGGGGWGERAVAIGSDFACQARAAV